MHLAASPRAPVSEVAVILAVGGHAPAEPDGKKSRQTCRALSRVLLSLSVAGLSRYSASTAPLLPPQPLPVQAVHWFSCSAPARVATWTPVPGYHAVHRACTDETNPSDSLPPRARGGARRSGVATGHVRPCQAQHGLPQAWLWSRPKRRRARRRGSGGARGGAHAGGAGRARAGVGGRAGERSAQCGLRWRREAAE